MRSYFIPNLIISYCKIMGHKKAIPLHVSDLAKIWIICGGLSQYGFIGPLQLLELMDVVEAALAAYEFFKSTFHTIGPLLFVAYLVT